MDRSFLIVIVLAVAAVGFAVSYERWRQRNDPRRKARTDSGGDGGWSDSDGDGGDGGDGGD